MELSAIVDGGRKRDFYDLYFLLKHYQLKDLLSFYEQRFSNISLLHVCRSLSYFDDAETDPDPDIFEKVDWQLVKSTILKEIRKILL